MTGKYSFIGLPSTRLNVTRTQRTIDFTIFFSLPIKIKVYCWCESFRMYPLKMKRLIKYCRCYSLDAAKISHCFAVTVNLPDERIEIRKISQHVVQCVKSLSLSTMPMRTGFTIIDYYYFAPNISLHTLFTHATMSYRRYFSVFANCLNFMCCVLHTKHNTY